ncbi:hypothetical protein AB3G34_15490 [Flavobacterium sp. WC2409]|uniref:Uncharacterized protein n=1 Tax=Flavobacterium sp. WC2409 TaxID=3234139 RepID=A0AB39W357_9FLAO
MNKNLYWSVFKNLEKELIELSNQIHIDDNQLNVYSVKISELLIRTVVEIESLSKELYQMIGGTKPNDKTLFFDTDCIQLIEERWKLSKKKVFISAVNFYLNDDKNRIQTPLRKANKMGSSSSDWQKAYQAVKHNRVKNLSKGNLKNLIQGLAALYLMNVYYKDTIFESVSDSSGTNFDSSMGSSIFSIKTHRNNGIHPELEYNKLDDFDECTYLIKATDKTREELQKTMAIFNDEYQKKISQNTVEEIGKLINEKQILINVDKNILIQKIRDKSLSQVNKEILINTKNFSDGLNYEAVLNKQQY